MLLIKGFTMKGKTLCYNQVFQENHMKRIFTSVISLVLFLGLFASTPDFSMVGFATLNGGTTGGSGGTETTVTTYEQLKAAVFGTSPKIVYVVGKIEVVGGEIGRAHV